MPMRALRGPFLSSTNGRVASEMDAMFKEMFTHDSLEFTSHVEDYRFDLGHTAILKSNAELFDMWIHSPAFTSLKLDVMTLVLPQHEISRKRSSAAICNCCATSLR